MVKEYCLISGHYDVGMQFYEALSSPPTDSLFAAMIYAPVVSLFILIISLLGKLWKSSSCNKPRWTSIEWKQPHVLIICVGYFW